MQRSHNFPRQKFRLLDDTPLLRQSTKQLGMPVKNTLADLHRFTEFHPSNTRRLRRRLAALGHGQAARALGPPRRL